MQSEFAQRPTPVHRCDRCGRRGSVIFRATLLCGECFLQRSLPAQPATETQTPAAQTLPANRAHMIDVQEKKLGAENRQV